MKSVNVIYLLLSLHCATLQSNGAVGGFHRDPVIMEAL